MPTPSEILRIFKRWCVGKALVPSLILPAVKDCVSPCYDNSRLIVCSFGALLVLLAVVSALSDRVTQYRRRTGPWVKLQWCFTVVSCAASAALTAYAVSIISAAAPATGNLKGWRVTRTQQSDVLLARAAAYHSLGLLLNGLLLLTRQSLDTQTCYLHIISLAASLGSLGTGEGCSLAVLFCLFGVATPCTQIRHFLWLLDAAPDSIAVSLNDIISLACMSARLLALCGFLLALDPGVCSTADLAAALLLGATGAVWCFDFISVCRRLGGMHTAGKLKHE